MYSDEAYGSALMRRARAEERLRGVGGGESGGGLVAAAAGERVGGGTRARGVRERDVAFIKVL